MKKGDRVIKTFSIFNWNDLWWRDVECNGDVEWKFWPLISVNWRRWKQFKGGLIWWSEIHFIWNVKTEEPKSGPEKESVS